MKVECIDGTLSEDEATLVKMLDEGKANMIVCSPGFMSSAGVSEFWTSFGAQPSGT